MLLSQLNSEGNFFIRPPSDQSNKNGKNEKHAYSLSVRRANDTVNHFKIYWRSVNGKNEISCDSKFEYSSYSSLHDLVSAIQKNGTRKGKRTLIEKVEKPGVKVITLTRYSSTALCCSNAVGSARSRTIILS